MTKTYYRAKPNGYTLTDTENIKLFIPDMADDIQRIIATENAIDSILAGRVIGDIPQEQVDKRLTVFNTTFNLFAASNDIDVDKITSNENSKKVLDNILYLRSEDLARKAIALDTYAYMKEMSLAVEEFLDLVPPMIKIAAHNNLEVLEKSHDFDSLLNGAMREKVRTHIIETSEIVYTHNFLAKQRTRQENLTRFKNDPVQYLLNCTVDEFGDCGFDWL